MEKLIKPERLKKDDVVAIISYEIASDHDALHRYELAKYRLQSIYGVQIVETSNTDSTEFAHDFLLALKSPSVKAIILNCKAEDSFQVLPLIDWSSIYENPKILIGHSDLTAWTTCFATAGVMSYYGSNILTQLGKVDLEEDTMKSFRKVFFSSDVIGQVNTTKEEDAWLHNTGYKVIQGKRLVRGRLFGGSGGALWQMIDAGIFPAPCFFDGCILYLEFGSLQDSLLAKFCMLRTLKAAGVFQKAAGMVTEYLNSEETEMLLRFMKEEVGREDMPILMNGDYVHPTPMTVFPIGAMAEICCDKPRFTILESGVW